MNNYDFDDDFLRVSLPASRLQLLISAIATTQLAEQKYVATFSIFLPKSEAVQTESID
ncbi:hypothetical protein [Aeromonas dhakensis]|uniref:hypothetical protein n=1 Tax=Aeromonas dhakensis TaxID=196024 RepID=UPI003BA2C51B